MATRPNKKRKGRTNAPPRERTVTTLTHASAGPFSLPPPTLHDDLSAPDLVAAAAAQRSAAAAALLSPHLSYSVSPPIANFSDHWNALSAPPPSYPLSFSSNLNTYNPMTPILGGPYPPQHSPPHYFPPPHPQQPPSQQVQTNHHPSAHPLPPGQSDLEILEKLKETIKKNQHDIFRPVPQPAALASVYLGPKPPLPSLVPPHPEQLPADPSPPGLTLYADDASAPPKSVAAPLSPAVSPASPPVLSQRPDVPNTPARRSTASHSPKLNQAPVKRHVDTHDSGASSSHKPDAPLVASVPSAKQPDDKDLSPPGLHRYQSAGRLSPLKNSRNELSTTPVISHDTPIVKEDARAREPGWGSRNGTDGKQHSQADRPPRARPVLESPVTADHHGPANGSGTRVLSPKEQRIQDRDRQPEKNKEHERDRARPPPRDHSGRDDRPRTADSRRLSRSPDAPRRFESRFPPRRYSKASETSFTSPRLSDRSTPKSGPPRNLGEERAIVRPPPAATASRPSLPDERRGLPSSVSAEERAARPPALDDRRGPAVPLVADRASNDSRPRPLSPLPDRAGRRRPPSPPANERAGIGHDDRRRAHTPPLNDRPAAHLDVRREPVPPSPLVPLERSPRLPAADDRRLVPSSGERPGVPSSAEDRRPSGAADRPPKSAVPDERRTSFESRLARPLPASLPDSVPPRPILDERGPRLAPPEDRGARPAHIPLEERISRAPSLHERLSGPPVRPDDKPAPRLKDRLSWPAPNTTPSLEERLSNPAPLDERVPRAQPQTDDRPLRPAQPPPPLERPVPRHAVDDRERDRSVMAEPARRAAPPAGARSDERVFMPAERFARPATPAGSDRGHAPPPSARPYRPPSVATVRDESPGRSPVRPEVREFRPASAAAAGPGEPRERERERSSYRSGPGPEVRYPPERRTAPTPAPASSHPLPPPPPHPPTPSAPGPELMDVDPVHTHTHTHITHVTETRLSYRRPSPPPPQPVEPYAPRERAWVPARDAYRDAEPVRRAPPDSHVFPRGWGDSERDRERDRERERERPYGDEWSERAWERQYDRDRFVEREAVLLPAWETREERERRAAAAVAYPPNERPLSARLTDAYPPEDRAAAYVDRGRYPPVDAPPPAGAYSRVRPRSPSPLRRSGGASDDMRRPPPKRAREDGYGSVLPPPPPPPPPAYYADEPLPPPSMPLAAEYAPRLRTPAPLPPGAAYYDDMRYAPSPERDFLDMRERERDYGHGLGPYERRDLAPARMPPPPPPPLPPHSHPHAARTPPPYGRASYVRDDRRY